MHLAYINSEWFFIRRYVVALDCLLWLGLYLAAISKPGCTNPNPNPNPDPNPNLAEQTRSSGLSISKKCTWVAIIVEIYIFRSVPSASCNTLHTNPTNPNPNPNPKEKLAWVRFPLQTGHIHKHKATLCVGEVERQGLLWHLRGEVW